MEYRGPISPRLQAASDDLPALRGFGCWGLIRGITSGPTPTSRVEFTGIVDHLRGEDHPTARLLDLVPGRSGTVYKNWLAEREKTSVVQIATLDPFQGQQERHWSGARKRTKTCCA